LSKGFICEVQGFHSCVPEGSCHLGYDDVTLGEWFWMFWWTCHPLSL